jgi:spermidine synthase
MQIGFGTGGTCHSVALHPEVERIDCVEINPGVIAAAHYFEEINHGIFRPGADPRVTVIIEDARNFVLTTDQKYDIILSDSIHPRFTGNGLLYTRDYFEICARVLQPTGIFSTWLPTAFLGPEEYKTIVRTMQSVFPHVLIWYMNNTVEGYTIVMGRRQPFATDFTALSDRLDRRELADDLAVVHLENIYDLLDCIAMGGPQVRRYLGDGLLNTEDRPIIEFRAPRNMNRLVTEYRNLQDIIRYRNFPEQIMQGWASEPLLAKARRDTLLSYFRATSLVLDAHQAHLLGQYAREQELYQRALAINPHDRDALFLSRRLQRLSRGEKLDW